MCNTIKATEELSLIPIIVLSTHPKIDVLKQWRADDVIEKPFDIEKLISIIEEAIKAQFCQELANDCIRVCKKSQSYNNLTVWGSLDPLG